MSAQVKSPRKERNIVHEKNGNLVKDSSKQSKGLKLSNAGDKKKQKRNEKEYIQRKETTGKDPLEEAVFALGGDAEDYQLVKDISADEDESGDWVAEEDPAIAKDVAKFLKGLGISKKAEPKEWVVEDDQVEEMHEFSGTSSSSIDSSAEDEPARLASLTVNSAVTKKEKGKSKNQFVFPPSPHWYNALEPISSITIKSTEATLLSEPAIHALITQAAQLLSTDAEFYASQNGAIGSASTSDAAFLSRVLSSGTLSDRLSALTLMVQASPIHNQRALESLKSMSMKKGAGAGAGASVGGGKGESLKSLRALVDWWVGGGVPDRKLRYFRDQPLLHENRTQAHLVVWFFEDWLKKFFFSILQILEVLTLDPLPYIRMQAMSLVSQLLTSKPEQEQNLLKLLVNKLGDSERSISSKASYHLHMLLQVHPQMKGVVVREVSSLVLKAPSSLAPPVRSKGSNSIGAKKPTASTPKGLNINSHARYYAIVTFNQIVLSSKTQADKDVATRLVEVYFELFRGILGEGNRPAADHEDNEAIKTDADKDGKGREEKRKMRERDKLRMKGKERPSDTTNGRKVSGGGLQDGTANSDAESKVISAILTGVNRALPFAGMDNTVLDKHMDTLFRITHEATFNVTIQALLLIEKVAESKPEVLPRYLRTLYASILDPRLAVSSKQAMYLNLLFKSLKLDKNTARVKAFVKRFLQALMTGPGFEPSFICGGLFLLGELFGVTPGLRAALSTPSNSNSEAYDSRKREPEYSGAGEACIWELIPLLHHYHPSVSLHARQLLECTPLTANADLSLNTISHFLDLFVYKNPKKPKPRGASAMQPAASIGNDGNTTVRRLKGTHNDGLGTGGTVNEEDFWSKKVQDVPATQLFFHKFFNQKQERRQLKKEKVDKRKSVKGDHSDVEDDADSAEDAEDSDSDKEEAEIWKAMKNSLPSAGADGADIESDNSDYLPVPDNIGEDSEDEALSSKEKSKSEDDNIEDSGLDDELNFEEEEDDLVGSDGDAPDGLLHFSSEEEDEKWGGTYTTVLGKRKGGEEDAPKAQKKKRRLKDLPLFASAEDYQRLIDGESEDNL